MSENSFFHIQSLEVAENLKKREKRNNNSKTNYDF